jgi:hypothetical protein
MRSALQNIIMELTAGKMQQPAGAIRRTPGAKESTVEIIMDK